MKKIDVNSIYKVNRRIRLILTFKSSASKINVLVSLFHTIYYVSMPLNDQCCKTIMVKLEYVRIVFMDTDDIFSVIFI